MTIVKTLCSAILAGTMTAALPAVAQDPVSADSISRALKPLTRSLGGSTGLSTEQEKFVDGLKGNTRTITVVERKKLIEIVERHDLPAIDLEILFEYDSAEITSESVPHLIQLGIALRDEGLADATILLNGHTDAVGSDAYNQKLSEARALSVRDFLTRSFEIDPYRLIAVGFGEEQLKLPDFPEAPENRRVQIVNVSR